MLPVCEKEGVVLTGFAEKQLSANVRWDVISQISAFIFCSMRLRPRDFFQPNIDWQRRDWRGLLHGARLPRWHIYSFSNSLLRADKTKWVVAWLRSLPPTSLTICLGSHRLFRASLSVLYKLSDQLHAWTDSKQLQYGMSVIQGSQRGRSWAADNSLSAKGRWGGGSGSREAGSKAFSRGLCPAGRQAGRRAGACNEWLAHAPEAPDGQAGTHASGVRGPGVTLCICSPCQDPGRAVMFGQPSPLSSPQSWGRNSSWARDESKTQPRTWCCVDARGKPVAVVQIGSESTDSSLREIGFGIWMA